ncbi:unnamed protein product [Closterium sp. Naga37s-1]|nr:unnamed protein product [Closterium sp. Naga37s-1]
MEINLIITRASSCQVSEGVHSSGSILSCPCLAVSQRPLQSATCSAAELSPFHPSCLPPFPFLPWLSSNPTLLFQLWQHFELTNHSVLVSPSLSGRYSPLIAAGLTLCFPPSAKPCFLFQLWQHFELTNRTLWQHFELTNRSVLVSPSLSGRYSLPFVAQQSQLKPGRQATGGRQLGGYVPVAPVMVDSYSDKIAGSQVPALVVNGERDHPDRAQHLASLFVNHKLVIFKGAGHACYMEQPDYFNSLEATAVLAEAFGGATQPRDVDAKRMWDFIFVPTYPCPRERRIGRAGDGGKWTCILKAFFAKPKITVFSIGSHGDPSFENAVQKVIHAKPYTFDPFLNATTLAEMQSQPFMRFRNAGLVGSRTKANATRQFPGVNFVTLEEGMQQAGRDYIDIFKIDCEGCEYPVLDDLMERYTARRNPPIGQLLIEFHGATTALGGECSYEFMRRLKKSSQCKHIVCSP